jgi:hypothetical protein
LWNGDGHNSERILSRRSGSKSLIGRELQFIEDHMKRYIYSISLQIKASIPFLGAAVAKENTFSYAKV